MTVERSRAGASKSTHMDRPTSSQRMQKDERQLPTSAVFRSIANKTKVMLFNLITNPQGRSRFTRIDNDGTTYLLLPVSYTHLLDTFVRNGMCFNIINTCMFIVIM